MTLRSPSLFSWKLEEHAFINQSFLARILAVLSLHSSMEIIMALRDSYIMLRWNRSKFQRINIKRNSIHVPIQLINLKKFFFNQSIEIILRTHKFLNTILKIRGHLIKISIRVFVGITIIIRGITRKGPRIKVSSIRVVTKIIPTKKIHIHRLIIFSIKVDKGISLGSIGVLLVANNFISSSIFPLKTLISSIACTFLLVDLSVCH